MTMDIVGHVETGLGRAAGFTGLPWVRRQLGAGLGIDPCPGTLNLRLAPGSGAAWRALAGRSGCPILPEVPGDCGARGYPVRVAVPGRGPVTAAIVLPEVPAYPPDKVEVVAAIPLRDTLGLRDGDAVTLASVACADRRAVIFDVDGTLVNSIEGYQLAAARALEPYGWSVSPDAVSRALNYGESFWDLVIPPESRGDRDLVAQLRRETMAHWPAILEESVCLHPGLEAVLDRLRASGLRLGICTASRGESFRPLERAGVLGCFEVIVTARDVERRKPDPEGLLLCLERLGVQATQALYVGDSVADMAASHAAGLFSVGVLTGAGDSSLLSGAGAHRILPDLQSLPDLLLDGQASRFRQ